MTQLRAIFREKWQNIDKGFLSLLLILVVCSAVSILSASSTLINRAMAAGEPMYSPIAWHIIFLLAGVILAFGIQFLSRRAILWIGRFMLGLSIISLVLTFTGLGVSANDSARWLKLGFLTFQPSEFAKLSLIIVVADLLSRIQTDADKKKYFWIVLGLTGLVCLLILFSNLSTVVLIVFVIAAMMFLSPIPKRWLLYVFLVLLTVAGSGYLFVEKHYIENGVHMTGPLRRAETWVGRIDDKLAERQNKGEDGKTIIVTDDNYQATMARIAVARGGVSPMGVLPGNSIMRDKLPLAYMDYIFAIIVEETGVIGVIIFCLLYLMILVRACVATSSYVDEGSLIMVMGLAIMLTAQALMSMAVAVGLGPVTGQPLPLMSKGGTNIIITCVYFGIMMAMAMNQNRAKSQVRKTKEESRRLVPEIETEETDYSSTQH